jgi:hypothetical protein
MWILDLTSLLQLDITNYYVFNLGMAPYRDSLYLCVYRVCKYDINISYHPWKIWDNGYKFFPDSQKVIGMKYRKIGVHTGEINHSIEVGPNAVQDMSPQTPEFDSTGICLLRFTGDKFELVFNLNNLFNGDMNQDCRIYKVDDKYLLTYNVFESDTKTKTKYVKMKKRTLYIKPHPDSSEQYKLHLTAESYMYNHIYKNVDKNCVYIDGGVLYEIGKTLDIIANPGTTSQKMVRASIPRIANIIDHYGKDRVFVSASTPPIKYTGSGQDRWLVCGHIKISYKQCKDISPFSEFMGCIEHSHISAHGKYIYLMFLCEYEANGQGYKVTRVSNPFIPTDGTTHLPYVLCIPIGLCEGFDGKVAISYGEGDCRCKVAILNKKEIEGLLVGADKTDPSPLRFYFFSPHRTIQHYGYFNSMNCGDDAFKIVFRYLRDLYYPNTHLAFKDPYNVKDGYDLTVLGGGDVVNKFFVDKIANFKKVAVGVGVPYEEFTALLPTFSDVIMRNSSDFKKYKKQGLIKSGSYAPDLTFLLSKILGRCQRKPKHIGISLIRTYYNPQYPELYTSFVDRMAKFIAMVLDAYDVTVVLIPFCFNPHNNEEDDMIMMTDVYERLRKIPGARIRSVEIFKPSLEHYVEEIYYKIGSMEFMVCSRFHSHIFSTLHAVPFISLTCGKKCLEYMSEIGMNDHVFRLKTNRDDIPIDFSERSLFEFFKLRYTSRDSGAGRLDVVLRKYTDMMDQFIIRWRKIIKQYLSGGVGRIYPTPNDEPRSPPFGIARPKPKVGNHAADTSPDISEHPPIQKKSGLHKHDPDDNEVISRSLEETEKIVYSNEVLLRGNDEKMHTKDRGYASGQELYTSRPIERVYIQPEVKERPIYVEVYRPQEQIYTQYIERPVYVQPQPQYMVERPVYAPQPQYMERPVYIPQPQPQYIDRPTYAPQPQYVDRPVYIQPQPCIERPVYISQPPPQIERPVYVSPQPVYVSQPQVERTFVPAPQPQYMERPIYVPVERSSHNSALEASRSNGQNQAYIIGSGTTSLLAEKTLRYNEKAMRSEHEDKETPVYSIPPDTPHHPDSIHGPTSPPFRDPTSPPFT